MRDTTKFPVLNYRYVPKKVIPIISRDGKEAITTIEKNNTGQQPLKGIDNKANCLQTYHFIN